MKNNVLILIFALVTVNLFSQVGTNTQIPKAIFEVVGKPTDVNHFDGIIPPRITGGQLASKTYPSAQKGAFVYVTSPATNLSDQFIHVVEEGYFYFNGIYWVQILKEPIYYDVLIILDETITANTISEQTSWNSYLPFSTNPRQHTLATKIYRLGTEGLGISGQMNGRRIGMIGYLNVTKG